MYNVVFRTGSYGTYLSWCIYTYSELNSERKVELPFSSVGSAHQFRYQEGIKIIRPIHVLPPVGENVIFIEPLLSKSLEYWNNYYMKERHFDDNVILDLFDSKKKLSIHWQDDCHERWQKRELLSFCLPELFKNSVNHHNYELTNYNAIKITSDNIINSLNETVLKILDFFNLTPIDTIKDLPNVHETFCSLQKNINKDEITLKYVDAAINGRKFIIKNSTLYDEAWIQHLLRIKGFDIKCWNLNQFPTCASKLTHLLERNND